MFTSGRGASRPADTPSAFGVGSPALNFPVLTLGKASHVWRTPTRPHSAPKQTWPGTAREAGAASVRAPARPAPSAARPPPRAGTRRGKRAAANCGRHFGFSNWAEASGSLLSIAARLGRLGRATRRCRGEGHRPRGTEKGRDALLPTHRGSRSRKGGAASAPAAGPASRMRAERGGPRRRERGDGAPGGLM